MALDPLTSSVIATGVVNGASSIGSGIIGLLNNRYNKEQNEWNKAFAREQFDFQKNQFEYQKGLNTQLFKREDNAVQRRALDLQAAGLSKTLAAGDSAQASVSPASASAVSGGAQGQRLNNFEKEIIGNQIAGQLAQIKQVRSQSSLNSKQESAIESENNLRAEQGNTQRSLQDMYKSQSNYYNELAKSQPSYRKNLQSQSELNEVMKEYNISKTVAQDWDNFYNEFHEIKSNDKPHWIIGSANWIANKIFNTFSDNDDFLKLDKETREYLRGIGVENLYDWKKFRSYLKNRDKKDWK